MKRKAYRSKKWLTPETTGFIFTEVLFDYNWNATLKIGDCSRIVDLDVYIEDEKARKKTLKKLLLLEKEISTMIAVVKNITYG